jgi:tetratricopeptide (TPR) repeat protein
MKPKSKPFAIKMVLSVFSLFLLLFLSQNAFAANTIEGTIYDKQRNPLPDIDVELLDEYYRMIQRARTDSTGRYSFGGLGNATYTVRVLAFRYDYQDQDMMVEAISQGITSNQSTTGSSSISQGTGYFRQDFYLMPKKGGLRDAELGVVFAQEVPKEAETAYKKGVDYLSKKKTVEGLAALMEAVQKYDKYYDAITRLGREFFINKKYVESFQYYRQAVEINPKSAASWYYMGMALNKLGKDYNKSALTALKQASTLAPSSQVVFYMLGKVEREEGKLLEAEDHLLKAKKLSPEKVAEIHDELYHLYADDLKKYNLAADELELFLKATKLNEEDQKKVKKTIADLREKAKTQASN